MKRLFINILYIVLLVVAFAYMMVNYDMSSASYMNMCIIDYANKYGIAGIGMFLLVPSFVFSILAIVIQTPVKVKLSFVRDTLSLCAGVFCLAAAVYATAVSENIFVPLLETVITLGITVTSLVRIIKVLKNDKETVEA